jgi:hypothetical protein
MTIKKLYNMKKEIQMEDLSYPDKVKIFREYGIKDHIRDYINVICDECINFQYGKPSINIPFWYKQNNSTIINYFGTSTENEISKDDYEGILMTYDKIMSLSGFDNELNLWHLLKEFLVDGFIAIEMIWDDKKQNIIGFNRLNPTNLAPAYDATHGKYWILNQDNIETRRVLYDSQIIHLAYSTQDYKDISYVHSLIKPFNQLSILEVSVILAYTVNEKESNLNMPVPDTKLLEYFSNALRKASRIPAEYHKFTNNPTNIANDIDRNTFNKFIKRVKYEFKKVISKPLQLQLEVKFPHIENIKSVNITF